MRAIARNGLGLSKSPSSFSPANNTWTPAFLHKDHLGSVRVLSGPDGTPEERTLYRPYGAQSEVVTATLNDDKSWLGERYDAGAGLQYLNARYYDPELAMFLQPDWFEVMQPGVGTNRYSYSFGDPVNKMDPGGNSTGEETPLLPPTDGSEDTNDDNGDDDESEPAAPEAAPEEIELAQAGGARPGSRTGVPSSPAAGVRQAIASQLQNEIRDLYRKVNGREHPGFLQGPAGSVPSNREIQSLVQQRNALGAEAAARGGGGRALVNQYNSAGYPLNGGFAGATCTSTLPRGAVVDRYGNSNGTYVAPAGTPKEQRSLLPGTASGPPTKFEVTRPIEGVRAGFASPAYGQPGGGIQYELPRSTQSLVQDNFLRPIP